MRDNLIKLNIGEVKEIKLKDYSTYKVGGDSLMIFVNSVKSLIKLLKYLNVNSIKYKVIGNASNLIFSDSGYDGVLINLSNIKLFKKYSNYFTVFSGYNLSKFSMEVSNMGYTGMEFSVGIPGQIGGSIFMNAGCYGSSISNVLYKVKVLTEDYKIKTLYNKDLKFGYRDSIFKHSNLICLSATFKLDVGNINEIKSKIEEYRLKRFNSQPLEFPNAGSVFKNPEGLYAGKLIEDLGLKGKNVGGAYISEKHANFIVNKNNASSKDIVNLISMIKKEVKKKYNIELKCEQEIVE